MRKMHYGPRNKVRLKYFQRCFDNIKVMHLNHEMPRTNYNRYDTLYRCIRGKICVYCGSFGNTVDHFQPRSYVTKHIELVNTEDLFTVPACFECNSIAGAHFFRSIGAKRRYVQEKLESKHSRILNIPDWTQEELDELCLNLRTMIEQNLQVRNALRRRIAWRNVRNVDAASSAKDFGSDSVPENVEQISIKEKPLSPDKHGVEIDLTLGPINWKELTEDYIRRCLAR